MPCTATRSPGPAPLCRSALNVVIPAHNNGPASAAFKSSGSRATASCRAIMYCPYPPSRVTPLICSYLQVINSPPPQDSHTKQCPPGQPVPTRSPFFHSVTPPPISSITPATSCPGTRGKVTTPNTPTYATAPLRQTPPASTFICTSTP